MDGMTRLAAVSALCACVLGAVSPARGQTVVRNIDVHVESAHPVELLGHSENGAGWASMCLSPCDIPVPLTWTYQVRAQDASTSPTFELKPTRDDANIVVRPKSPARTGLGIGLLATGVLGGLAGYLLTQLGSVQVGCPGASTATGSFPGGCDATPNKDYQVVGPIVMLASLAAVVSGILLIVDGSTMHASQVE
jgi:hypothetical protein